MYTFDIDNHYHLMYNINKYIVLTKNVIPFHLHNYD